MAKETWYINDSELDDYQTPIIQKKMNSSFVVKGCAGSGKTVLALWKAREIVDAELGSYYVFELPYVLSYCVVISGKSRKH